MTCDSDNVDPRVLIATPNVAIEMGANLSVMQTEPPHTPLYEAASQSHRTFKAYVATFAEESRERFYLSQLESAAVNLGTGIIRRKTILKEHLTIADLEMHVFHHNFSAGPRVSGYLWGCVKLLLVCGLFYALLHWLIGKIPAKEMSTQHNKEIWNLVIGFVAILAGASFRGYYLGWQLKRALTRYKLAINAAHAWYRKEVTEEYKQCADTSRVAWKQLTGKSPPLTSSLESLLASVLHNPDEEKEKTFLEVRPIPQQP